MISSMFGCLSYIRVLILFDFDVGSEIDWEASRWDSVREEGL